MRRRGCCGDDPQVACVDRIPRACAGVVGGWRVCVNGVIDDFLTDPLSEITRSSQTPLSVADERKRPRQRCRERAERLGSARHSPAIVVGTRCSSCSPLQKAANCSTPPPPTTLSSFSSQKYRSGFIEYLEEPPRSSRTDMIICTAWLMRVCTCTARSWFRENNGRRRVVTTRHGRRGTK